jgi:Flp pilus assembly protein TadG
MKINKALRATLYSRYRLPRFLSIRSNSRGQAAVEFTLVFMLLIIILWIPADFGLAFLTGQLATNAAREGARIGSASTPFVASDVVTETCRRLPSALMTDPGATAGFTTCSPFSTAIAKAELVAGSGACNQMVQVTVKGSYNFLFYRLLSFIGVGGNLNTRDITRTTLMRWEHQC